MKYTKKERQKLLLDTLDKTPFITDEHLASTFKVSVQTIRLDRMELSIPELRERIKSVATDNFGEEVKSLPIDEVIGEIIDIDLDRQAISLLDISKDHVFARNGIARGHHLFAQANSLAVAVINDELALTRKSTITFVKPVKAGDRVIAKAIVISNDVEKNTTLIEVTSKVENDTVFVGKFSMYRVTNS